MSALTARHNLIGIAFLLAGAFVFSTQDAIIKSISGSHSVTLAIVLRGLVAFPVILFLVWWEGGLKQLETPLWKVLCLRGLILLVAYTTYFMAFPALPLAEAIALFFLTPLLVTVMAGPLLGERVKLMAWGAVAVGLVGVFFILQPGTDLFNPAALLSLISGATYALSMIMARKQGGEATASVMAFYQNAVYLLGALLFATFVGVAGIEPPGHPSLDFLFRSWDYPSAWDLMLMGTCGVIAAFGMTFLTQAYRMGEANVVTPFEYSGLVWGTLFGFLFFDEVPRSTTFIGMAMIAAAGILALRAAK
jgi:drug/metabolite transporter (DMT)-like permease